MERGTVSIAAPICDAHARHADRQRITRVWNKTEMQHLPYVQQTGSAVRKGAPPQVSYSSPYSGAYSVPMAGMPGGGMLDAGRGGDRDGENCAKAQKKGKRKRIAFAAIAVIVSLLLLACGSAFAYVGLLNYNMSSNNALFANGTGAQLADWNGGDVPDTLPDDFYMLLLGVDSNTARTAGVEVDMYGGVFRSDTIILAHVSLDDKNVSLCSFSRDIKTEIDGYEGEDYKLNAAYALGGVDLMRTEVEQLAGVDIPYYAVVDMDGFVHIIDALGGIEVDVEYAFYDNQLEAGIDQAGPQTLNGQQALLYARARHAWDDMGLGPGDMYRAKHQRQVISSFADKFSDANLMTLSNVGKVVSQNVSTNLNISQIVEIAYRLQGMSSDTMSSLSTPTVSSYENDVWYEILDEDAWQQVLALFKENVKATTDGASDIVVEEDLNGDGVIDENDRIIAGQGATEDVLSSDVPDGYGRDADGNLFIDEDGDGKPDYGRYIDEDGDGIPDGGTTFVDNDGDGIPDGVWD